MAKLRAPYRDVEIAGICRWLIAQGLTMHVTLDCHVSFQNSDGRAARRLARFNAQPASPLNQENDRG